MLVELKKLIEGNPFSGEVTVHRPQEFKAKYSHQPKEQLCNNPWPNPDIKILFVGHSCGLSSDVHALSPANNPLLGAVPKPGGFSPLGSHVAYVKPLAGWKSNPPTRSFPSFLGGPLGLGGPSIAGPLLNYYVLIVAGMKHPRTPFTNPSADFPLGDSDHTSKRIRPMYLDKE